MYVTAIHDISDPEKFWGSAETTEIPEGITLHSSFPNADGSRAVCLWEADSVEAVRDFVDGGVGDASQNEFYGVNAQNAQGLPTSTTSA
jgi:hypothetical protein